MLVLSGDSHALKLNVSSGACNSLKKITVLRCFKGVDDSHVPGHRRELSNFSVFSVRKILAMQVLLRTM